MFRTIPLILSVHVVTDDMVPNGFYNPGTACVLHFGLDKIREPK